MPVSRMTAESWEMTAPGAIQTLSKRQFWKRRAEGLVATPVITAS